jgi:hypothetical protein
MTARQALALAHPCHRAVETTHARFTELIRPWFTILTINK